MTWTARSRPSSLTKVKVPSLKTKSNSPPQQRGAEAPQKKEHRFDAVLKCSELWQWLDPECSGFAGMLVQRQQTWCDIQEFADRLHESGIFGREESMKEHVPVTLPQSPQLLQSAVDRLVQPLENFGMPRSITEQIKRDALEISATVGKLVPGVGIVILKLELMKENCCLRWHQDNYVSRAICTYNCSGTEYIHHDHVDFWELNNCGNNDCVVKDKTPICNASVGDILFIKGKLFPGEVNGMVHRSPPFTYHDNGDVKTRLCLKVDVAAL